MKVQQVYASPVSIPTDVADINAGVMDGTLSDSVLISTDFLCSQFICMFTWSTLYQRVILLCGCSDVITRRDEIAVPSICVFDCIHAPGSDPAHSSGPVSVCVCCESVSRMSCLCDLSATAVFLPSSAAKSRIKHLNIRVAVSHHSI